MKACSHQANRPVTDKKSFYPFYVLFLPGESAPCRVISVSSTVESFEPIQTFSSDKMDRDPRLMYSYVAYTLHKLTARALSVRGDRFCHRITKCCMFCLFFLRNKSVSGLTKPPMSNSVPFYKSVSKCNTILSAYTMYRRLE